VIRLLPYAGAAVLAALAAWWVMDLRLDRVQAEADRLALQVQSRDAVIDQHRAAAAVHRAHLARAMAEAARADDLQRDLQTMEGRNAPVSDHMRRAGERLWGR
jgi:predicted  nucleic acid-binding Zn-ribbon protein